MSGVDAAVPNAEPRRCRSLLVTFSSPVDPVTQMRPRVVPVGQTIEFEFEPSAEEPSVVSAFARWGAEKCDTFQNNGVRVVEIARIGYSIEQIRELLPCKVVLVIDFDHHRKDLLEDLSAAIQLLRRLAYGFEVILFARTSRAAGNPQRQYWQAPVMKLLRRQLHEFENWTLSDDVVVLSKETSRERVEFEKKAAESDKQKSKSKGGTKPWQRLYVACRWRLTG